MTMYTPSAVASRAKRPDRTENLPYFPVGNELDITSRAIKALSHPVRLQIINLLSAGELSVTELTQRVSTHSQSSISQHLGFLLKNGIVSNRNQGTQHFYKIADWRTGILIRMILETFCPKPQQQQAYADPARERPAA